MKSACQTTLTLLLFAVGCKSSPAPPMISNNAEQKGPSQPGTPNKAMTHENCHTLHEKLLAIKLASLSEEKRQQLTASDIEAVRHGLKPHVKNCVGSTNSQYACLQRASTKSDVNECIE